MNLSVRDTGAWQHTLDVEVPAEEIERGLDGAARELQRRVSLPGFRRGKVPLDMVRQNFAEHVEQEFLDSFLPRVTTTAVEQAHLSPVVPPLVRNVRFTPGQPMKFEAVVEVKPEIEARDYRGLPLTKRGRPVDEAAVERVLAGVREEAAVFVDLERPAQRGDVVLLDSARLDANGRRLPGQRAKGRRIQLGAPDLLPDLENGLLAAVAGQERTIEVHYPADYPAADLAGKAARYLVTIRKIQEKKLRELDDNFARDLFRLESLDALRARIRRNLEAEEASRVRRELESAVTEELVRRNPFDLPERLVLYMLDRVIEESAEGKTLDEPARRELGQRFRPGVERSLRREVLLDAIARQEQLAVTDEEVAQEIDQMAQADPRQAARVRARYQSAERRESLRASLLERKAMDLVIQAAAIREEKVGESPLLVPAGR